MAGRGVGRGGFLGNWGGGAGRGAAKKRSFGDASFGDSYDNYGGGSYGDGYNQGSGGTFYDQSTDPYYRGMDPPASSFSRRDESQDQYQSYCDTWDSGYYNESGISDQGFGSDYYQDQGGQQQQTKPKQQNYQQSYKPEVSKQSSDFSKDINIQQTGSNFNQMYKQNQQKWNKRGQNRGRGGRGNQGWMGNRGGQNQAGVWQPGYPGRLGKQRKQQPGLPAQKVFVSNRGGNVVRGNKRGRGNAAVAPVHSLAKVVVPDVTTMSIAEKIRRFCLYLQSDVNKVNAIQTIENALTGSKLGLKTDYEVEELMQVAGRWMYTGFLKLSGVFLARSVGANKKEVKHDTYQKSLEILKTKTVAEIFALKDPGIEAIRAELNATLETKESKPGQNETIEMAKKSVDVMSKTVSTLGEGFERLIEYLKTGSNLPESRISCIEQGMSASKCGLSHSYDAQGVRLPTGKLFFRGTLMIAGIAIATGKGFKKKDAKLETYEKALEALTTKPLASLLRSVSEADPLVGGTPLDSKLPTMPFKTNLTMKEKMVSMIDLIKEAQFKENNVNTIDVTAIHIGFTPTCIYRKIDTEQHKSMIICELYLDHILIATGEAERRKESTVEAYNNAWDVLCTSSADYILKEHKRLQQGDSEDPNVMDVWVKGSGKPNSNTNLPGLKRYKLDPSEKWKTVNTIVILEHEDWSFDRKRQAFCILNYSATLNGMLLQWLTEADNNLFKCTINLQNQTVGEACALGKNTARNLAAANALFKLYETQDVIKITRRDDTKLWIQYTEIEKKAEELKASGVEVTEGTEVKQEEDEENKRTVNKWVVKVAEGIITKHAEKPTLEELIFGPGMPLPESKEVRQFARSLDLKHDIRQQEGQSYLVIYNKMSPQDTVKCLKECGGTSGKYSLVPKSTLPTHSDIEPELQKHEAMRNTGVNNSKKTQSLHKPGHQGLDQSLLKQEQSFSNQGQDYGNQSQNFSGQGFASQGQDYSGQSYTDQSQDFSMEVQDFSSQNQSYESQNQSYTVESSYYNAS